MHKEIALECAEHIEKQHYEGKDYSELIKKAKKINFCEEV